MLIALAIFSRSAGTYKHVMKGRIIWARLIWPCPLLLLSPCFFLPVCVSSYNNSVLNKTVFHLIHYFRFVTVICEDGKKVKISSRKASATLSAIFAKAAIKHIPPSHILCLLTTLPPFHPLGLSVPVFFLADHESNQGSDALTLCFCYMLSFRLGKQWQAIYGGERRLIHNAARKGRDLGKMCTGEHVSISSQVSKRMEKVGFVFRTMDIIIPLPIVCFNLKWINLMFRRAFSSC